MRVLLVLAGIVLIAGCSNRMYFSPYDLNRDGTLDAECPGMEYDATGHSHYGWRSDASKACHESKESS